MINHLIREFVHQECNNNNNVLGFTFFEQHILLVKEYADKLAVLLGADREIVEIAAYLHDISAIQNFSTLPEHPKLSAELAKEILIKNSYEKNKIYSVEKCILTHSAPLQKGMGTLEEICISNADAISQIINPTYWLYFVFSIRKLNFKQGIEWYFHKVDSNWNGLIEQAKDLSIEKYLLVNHLLKVNPCY